MKIRRDKGTGAESDYAEREHPKEFQELIEHGESFFPFSIYTCVIPDHFTEVPTHWHEEMEIISIRKGRGIVTVDRESKELVAPAAALVLPGHMHSIRQSGKEKMEYTNLIFDPKILSAGNSLLFDQKYLAPLFEEKIQIPHFLTSEMACFEQLMAPIRFFDEKKEEEPGYPLLFLSQLYLICYRLLQCFPRIQESSDAGEALERIKPVLEYVHENYREAIKISDAAAQIDFSEGYFMRYFKKNMGVSFVTYLKDYRLSRAEEMIRKTDCSILEIAQENGFPNFSYFIRAFKEKYHQTPLRYSKEYESKI